LLAFSEEVTPLPALSATTERVHEPRFSVARENGCGTVWVRTFPLAADLDAGDLDFFSTLDF